MDELVEWRLVETELQGYIENDRLDEPALLRAIRAQLDPPAVNRNGERLRPYPLLAQSGLFVEVADQALVLKPVVYLDDEFAVVKCDQRNAVVGHWFITLSDKAMIEFNLILTSIGLSLDEPVKIDKILDLKLSESGIRLFGLTALESSMLAQRHPAIQSPTELHATLFPYQERGLAYLVMMREIANGCILGDDMGLGKTMQAIALMCRESELGRGSNLVVCPATLCRNWSTELKKFAPGLRVLEHSGPLRTGSLNTLMDFDIVISSYETMVNDSFLLGRIDWNCVVLDEAQAIKTSTAIRTTTAKALKRNFSLAVTGTPIENHLEDLWSILNFSEPSVLGTLSDFRVRFLDNEEDARIVQSLSSPLMLRRRLADIENELPELLQISQALEMSESTRTAYMALIENISNGSLHPLSGCQELRMICAHSRPHDDNFQDSAKVNRLIEILEEAFINGKKAIVFGSYREEIDLLVQRVSKAFAGSFVRSIDSRVPPNERGVLIDEFSDFPGAACLVLNTKAAGVGLNIVAANYVIHFNPELNPATTDQATKRAHRTGSTETVTAFHLYYADSIEEKIIQRAEDRRKMAEAGAPGSDEEPNINDVAWLINLKI